MFQQAGKDTVDNDSKESCLPIFDAAVKARLRQAENSNCEHFFLPCHDLQSFAEPHLLCFAQPRFQSSENAGFSRFWLSSSGWADVNITDLQSNTTAQVLQSRTSCVDLFCNVSQQTADVTLQPGGSYLIGAVHQNWQGPSHFLLSATGSSNNNNRSVSQGSEHILLVHRLQDQLCSHLTKHLFKPFCLNLTGLFLSTACEGRAAQIFSATVADNIDSLSECSASILSSEENHS